MLPIVKGYNQRFLSRWGIEEGGEVGLRVVSRTRHYLGYGGPLYRRKYPVRTPVPRVARLLLRGHLVRTNRVLFTGGPVSTIYSAMYGRRGRYRNRYILKEGDDPVRFDDVRGFVSSSCLSEVRIPGVRGGKGGMTIVNSKPTKVAITVGLTLTNCGMAVFRRQDGVNNVLRCKVPRFHLSGSIVSQCGGGVRRLKVQVHPGAIVKDTVIVSGLFHSKCDDIFMKAKM